jgi:hypothetical protein
MTCRELAKLVQLLITQMGYVDIPGEELIIFLA